MARRTRHEALVMSLLAQRSVMQTHRFAAAQGRDPDGRSWYRIENAAAAGPVEVFLYAEIGMWGVTADMFLDEITPLAGRDLTLRINSEGGEVFDGVAIYNALQRHGGRITAHVDGLAASAASFIAMAADEIVMEPGSQMMIHDAIGFCYGNEAEMEKMCAMLGRTSGTIAMIYAERAGGEAEAWREVMRGERWYDGASAVAAGLADRVGEGRPRDVAGGHKTADNRVAAGQGQPVNGPVIITLPADYYGEAPGERDSDGRFADGMPDVIVSYAIAAVTGAMTATRTHGAGVSLSDGANSVTIHPREGNTLVRALGNDYATEDTLITRNVEGPDGLHSTVIARVRPQGRTQTEDGEDVATGMRLDIGEVEDPDEYDSRQGTLLTSRQADDFADSLANARLATRVQTGNGPMDMYPTPGDGFGIRVKSEDGPVEVEFSRSEWRRINTAMDTVIDGFYGDEEDDPDHIPTDKVTVKTKAGKIDVEWKGERWNDQTKAYPSDSRMLIAPQGDIPPWSVVIDGDHMREVFDPLGLIGDAIGVNNAWRPRMRRRPTARPQAVRTRPGTRAAAGLPIVWDRDLDGSQLRGEDGQWVETPGTGIPWDRYAAAYDVYAESSTYSGIVVATMRTGEQQLAWDDAEDGSVRHVFADFEGPDHGPRELRDALRSAIASDTVGDWELLDPDDPTQAWATVTRNEESVVLYVPGEVERNDLEVEMDIVEAQELVDAFDEQIDRHGELDLGDTVDSPADTWDKALVALTTPQPVSSPVDDHPLPFWETP